MLLDETPLFDPALLQELDWSTNTISFSPPISPSNPGDGLVLRPLHLADFKRGEFRRGSRAAPAPWKNIRRPSTEFWKLLKITYFVNLFPNFPHLTGFFGVLSQLTKTGDVTAEQFSSQATRLFTTFYIIDKIQISVNPVICFGLQKVLSK